MRKSAFLLFVACAATAAAQTAAGAPRPINVTDTAWYGTWFGGMTGAGCNNLPNAAFLRGPGVSTYRPQLSGGTAHSALELDTNGAIILIASTDATDNQLHGSGTYSAIGIDGLAKSHKWKGKYAQFKIAPSLAKGGVTSSTQYVTISGIIKGAFGAGGCDLFFNAAYIQQRIPE
jgi:hypothetical protein